LETHLSGAGCRINCVGRSCRRAGDGRPFAAAIVHDWFQGYHGAERVVNVMRRDVLEGDADVFTFHAAREVLPPDLADAIVQESRLAGLPGIRQRVHEPGRWRNLLPYMPWYFRRLDLERYGLVISSSHAFASHVRPRTGALHVCYCYTPIRYAWLPDTERGRVPGIRGTGLRFLGRYLRRLDLAASRRPDSYIAISEAVRNRIRRFYGRDAVVIHPPVDVDEFSTNARKEPGRFLWVNRLVAYKRPDLVAEAFRGLPYRLTMVGVGPLEQRLRGGLPPNVELLGWVPREQLRALFEGASGFVHIGEEDFGISMVEALASGTPLIALNRGGAKDIVRPGRDGLLIEEASAELLREAVKEVATTHWDARLLAARAGAFSRARFVERFRAHLIELGWTP
jgi:glycosyltransferase involved in cell wall biosynthesis